MAAHVIAALQSFCSQGFSQSMEQKSLIRTPESEQQDFNTLNLLALLIPNHKCFASLPDGSGGGGRPRYDNGAGNYNRGGGGDGGYDAPRDRGRYAGSERYDGLRGGDAGLGDIRGSGTYLRSPSRERRRREYAAGGYRGAERDYGTDAASGGLGRINYASDRAVDERREEKRDRHGATERYNPYPPRGGDRDRDGERDYGKSRAGSGGGGRDYDRLRDDSGPRDRDRERGGSASGAYDSGRGKYGDGLERSSGGRYDSGSLGDRRVAPAAGVYDKYDRDGRGR
ncbi:hypothetical protein HDU93_004004 [Gonapodya sp. JEL0774]|nr:hypothetical protein HDU93_004004 [Gonapodya sp. JEL0774]